MPLGIAASGYVLLLGGACFLTLFRSWGRTFFALAVQSLGVGLVAAQISLAPVAIAKIIVGWIAAALLAVTLSREKSSPAASENHWISPLFRVSLLLFLFSSLIALLPKLSGVFRDPPAGILFAACFLIGVGLLNLGISEHPLRAGVGLITVLQGFELGYLWIEQSLLVLALLAATDLAVILVLIIQFSFSARSPYSETEP